MSHTAASHWCDWRQHPELKSGSLRPFQHRRWPKKANSTKISRTHPQFTCCDGVRPKSSVGIKALPVNYQRKTYQISPGQSFTCFVYNENAGVVKVGCSVRSMGNHPLDRNIERCLTDIPTRKYLPVDRLQWKTVSPLATCTVFEYIAYFQCTWLLNVSDRDCETRGVVSLALILLQTLYGRAKREKVRRGAVWVKGRFWYGNWFM